MNRTDKQTLDGLKNQFDKAKANAQIPEQLCKERIVRLVAKNGVSSKPHEMDGRGALVPLYRVTALVAMLTIAVVCALGMRLIEQHSAEKINGNDVVVAEIRNARNYDEIKEILLREGKTSGKSSGKQEQVATTAASSPVPTTSASGEQPTVPSQGDIPDVGIPEYSYAGAYLVKTDGEYIYIAAKGLSLLGAPTQQILIVRTYPADSMQLVSAVDVSVNAAGCDERIIGIYMLGKNLIAIIDRAYGKGTPDEKLETAAVIVDITDKTAPVKVRELTQSGSYLKSMLLNGKLYMMSTYSVKTAGKETPADSLIPSYTDNGVEHLFTASNIYCGVTNPESSYLVITTADIANPDVPVYSQAILGCGSDIYVSSTTFVAARQFSEDKTHDGTKEQYTELYCFNITQNGIEFNGTNVIEGTATDLISVDEYDGSIKIAAKDEVGSAVGESVYIFNDSMEKIKKYARYD